MTFAALHNAIRSRFGTEVEDAQSVPVAYDNAPFADPDETATWVRASILDGESLQVSLPSPSAARFRRRRAVSPA